MRKLASDFKKWNFKGIKLHQACTPFKNDSPEMNRITSFAVEKWLPLIIHLWSNKEACKLIELANNYPEMNFVLLHLIGLEVVNKYSYNLKNIHYEVSAYCYISRKRIKYAIDTLGADHIIFGSDTPFDKDALRKGLEKLRRMDLSDDQREQVLGRNIARILKKYSLASVLLHPMRELRLNHPTSYDFVSITKRSILHASCC